MVSIKYHRLCTRFTIENYRNSVTVIDSRECRSANLAKLNANIFFTDACLFTRIGVFNTHNEHYLSHVNPKLSKRHSYQHRFSLNVWASVCLTTLSSAHISSKGGLTAGGNIFKEMLPKIMPLAYL
jgi:hypothetical protein